MKYQDTKVLGVEGTNCEDGSLKLAVFLEKEGYGDRGQAYGIKLSKDCRDVKWLVAAMKAFIRRFERQSAKLDNCLIDDMRRDEQLEEVK